MRWRRVGWTLAGLLVGYVLVMGGVAWYLTRRPLAWQREPVPPGDAFEGVHVQTPDGQTLGAWLWPGHEDQCVVLVLHSVGSCRSMPWSTVRLRHLAAQGVGFLAISFRGHGDSTGDTLDHDGCRRDVISSVDYLEQRFPHRPIKLYGMSLGASVALMAAPELKSRVSGYLLEAPFVDLATAVAHKCQVLLPPGISQLVHLGLVIWAPVFVPGGLQSVNPRVDAAAIPPSVPVVIICGENDRRSQPWESEAILQAIGHGTRVVIPGGDHEHILDRDPELYWHTVDEWLKP